MTTAVADLVTPAMPLAAHLARRYRNRGEPAEELEQVAYLALTEAAHRFDPGRGADFLAFAVVWVDGALRHHFRDRTWVVRPPRRLVAARRDVAESAARTPAGTPVTAYVAADLGLCPDDVHRVLRLGSAYTPVSLDAHPGGLDALPWRPAARPDPYEQVESRELVRSVLRPLGVRGRHVVVRRFRDGWSQREIAAELGVSQMQVSRILRDVLRTLRATAGSEPGHGAG